MARYYQRGEDIASDHPLNAITGEIMDAAYKVHSRLGPGLLESIYEQCLAYELELKGLKVRRQLPVTIQYGDLEIENGLRIDLLVADAVVVELKAIETVLPVHRAQVMTYLKLGRHRIGMLINFNVPLIRDGVERIIL